MAHFRLYMFPVFAAIVAASACATTPSLIVKVNGAEFHCNPDRQYAVDDACYEKVQGYKASLQNHATTSHGSKDREHGADPHDSDKDLKGAMDKSTQNAGKP